MTFRDFIARLFTPRRSFAFREMERSRNDLETRLDASQAEVKRLVNYIAVFQAHIPVIFPATPDTDPVSVLSSKKPFTGLQRPPNHGDLDRRYANLMREELGVVPSGHGADEDEKDPKEFVEAAAAFVKHRNGGTS
jgi:hypothetical protein